MSPDSVRLLLVGCGKMGGAILSRVVKHNLAQVSVVDPARPPDWIKTSDPVLWMASPDKIGADYKPDIVILAIKPQQMSAVLPAYARFKDAVFLSIAAGMPIARMESFLGGGHAGGHAIVRSMPNLPASLGEGMSVAVANKKVSDTQRALCDRFLKAVGDTAWVEDENLMDAVTALSGSGPAYVFALCEAMAKAGEGLGFSPVMAAQLARKTIIGSAALLAQSSDGAETLRRAVTSPGGTTEAALKVLLADSGLNDLMCKAMKAAAQRGKELAG